MMCEKTDIVPLNTNIFFKENDETKFMGCFFYK